MKLSEEKAQHLENIRQELCQGTLSNKEAESMVLETIVSYRRAHCKSTLVLTLTSQFMRYAVIQK